MLYLSQTHKNWGLGSHNSQKCKTKEKWNICQWKIVKELELSMPCITTCPLNHLATAASLVGEHKQATVPMGVNKNDATNHVRNLNTLKETDQLHFGSVRSWFFRSLIHIIFRNINMTKSRTKSCGLTHILLCSVTIVQSLTKLARYYSNCEKINHRMVTSTEYKYV